MLKQKNNIEKNIISLLYERPVLITGADGFIGSHLTEELVRQGADVHVFIRATSSGALNHISHLQKKIKILRGDLSDKNAITYALKVLKKSVNDKTRKPIIFHLGAQAHVGESWQRPYETVQSNVVGTINLLQSILDIKLDILKLDAAGTSEEYGNIDPEMEDFYRFDKDKGLILDERSPLNPQSVYAVSKVATDFLTRSYHSAYGMPAVVSRMFNNYGPRQNPRFITGTIISQAFMRDTIELGDITPKRDFCFVKDGIRGHIYTTLFGKPGDVYVFGYGKTISMKEWYDLIIEIGKKKNYWKSKNLITKRRGRSRLGNSEVMELHADYSKLNKLTGWEPLYSWEKGLEETIDWYADNKDDWLPKVDWI